MFEVDPARIEDLDAKTLVILLRKLLHAEALTAGLSLAAVSVPLQITVPDNGEDGRIDWEGGVATTEFLPGRINRFQSKAGKLDRSGWKKECWTKSSQRRGAKRVLSGAIENALSLGGSYVGFTSKPLTNDKIDDFIAAIREGIKDADGDPTLLSAIKIYDANKIADWASRHVAVAAWLAEHANGQSVAGFRTVSDWARSDDFSATVHVEDAEPRFRKGARTERDEAGAENKSSATTAWRWVLDHIAEQRTVVRISGSSGLGKSRFVYEGLKSSEGPLAEIFRATTVFADYRVVPSTLLAIATRLASEGKAAILVVDECPRAVAADLAVIATAADSRLRVITIDTDHRPLDGERVLHVALEPSSGDLVRAIIKQKNSALAPPAVERLLEISGGFPRVAILAAGTADVHATAYETVDDVVTRLLDGAGLRQPDQVRSIEALAMFEALAWQGHDDKTLQLDLVAELFGRVDPDAMYEYLLAAELYHLVGRYGDNLAVQPSPVALHLAARRLSVLRPATLLRFVTETVDDSLVMAMVGRWRDLDRQPVVVDTAKRLVGPGGPLAHGEAVLTRRGARMIDALVHVVPDRVADRLAFVIANAETRELVSAGDARRDLVRALAKLVFRKESFASASRALKRLALAETENYANNATGAFKQLFFLYLSGTEVAPAERFAMLDEGLESADPQERALCVDALANAFRRDSTRFDDSGRIGTRERLIDWAPATRDDVDAFHQEALERLVRTRKERPELAERCEAILAGAVRAALSGDRYLAFAQILRDISEEKGFWPEAVESVGSWLFFDRRPEASERGTFVRGLYDELFPSDPVDRAIVFTKFWRANIRDPDIRYSEDDRDHGYANRASRALAIEIAGDPDTAIEAVRRMSALDLKEVFDFAEELAANASDKLGLIEAAVDTLIAVGPGTGNASVLRGLLRGTDRSDRDTADHGAEAAQERLDPAQWPLVNLHSAISIDGKRLARILTDIESGLLEPQHCIMLSYGRGLDELDPSDIARLALTLTTKGSEGAWAALEIAMMYRHGANVPAEHRHLVALLLGAPVLLASGHDRDRDAHLLGELATSVRATVGIDRPAAQAWCDQVIRLAVADDGGMLFALDSAMRKIVGLVREDMPDVAWGKFSHFYAAATPIERNRLKRLVGSEEDRFEGQAHTDAGPLFGVSEQSMFDWADEAEDGPSFLLDFYPILEKSGGDAAWHPALVTLVQRYGKSKPFLAALSRRIRPSSWSGSVVPLLEVFLNPLRGWFDHPLRLVQIWAQEEYRRIERRIEREKEHDREWMG